MVYIWLDFNFSYAPLGPTYRHLGVSIFFRAFLFLLTHVLISYRKISSLKFLALLQQKLGLPGVVLSVDAVN